MEKTKFLDAADINIEYAAQLIKNGQVVGVPTETVYGLAADALNPDAVKTIFAVKGRPADNPLIVHISSIKSVEKLAHDVPELFYVLADKFWPGPLTMIVPKNDIIPDVTSGGLDTIALRMPSNPVMRKLIELCGPIAAPSANTSGYPSPTKVSHVLHDLDGKIPAVIDYGNCKFGVESTVICFDDEKTVRILRPGNITPEMFKDAGITVVLDDAVINGVKENEKVKSPGMKYKHYSPKANLVILEGDDLRVAEFIFEKCRGNDFCLIPMGMKHEHFSCRYVCYEDDPINMACNIYDNLRELDELGAKNVYVYPPEKIGVGLAVYNRLLRAAGFEVIKL